MNGAAEYAVPCSDSAIDSIHGRTVGGNPNRTIGGSHPSRDILVCQE
jgi:hypothetical protein